MKPCNCFIFIEFLWRVSDATSIKSGLERLKTVRGVEFGKSNYLINDIEISMDKRTPFIYIDIYPGFPNFRPIYSAINPSVENKTICRFPLAKTINFIFVFKFNFPKLYQRPFVLTVSCCGENVWLEKHHKCREVDFLKFISLLSFFLSFFLSFLSCFVLCFFLCLFVCLFLPPFFFKFAAFTALNKIGMED